MISQATIQQILSRIDIIEIVGGFVKLKKRGTNYLGLCPFHNEKTPSFTVSPAKEIYKCFGCGRSGNTISFVMEHEKFSYAEALRWLAAKYNIAVEETEVSPEQKLQNQVAESLLIINAFAQSYFSQVLLDAETGSIGMSYLKERGFNDEVIKKFHLGFCPEEKDAFAREAVRQQYSRDAMIRSGLVALRNDELVDNYRGRIIFPIHNNTGKTIGFGARLIRSNDKAPKYINTPENEVYSKSKILYGTYQARQAIDKNDECLLVEGYTDVISLHQAGIENVVASGGTSLTQDQLRLIKKYTSHLTIIYDGDAAGIKAALRGMEMALDEGLDVKMVLIPDREDPDSFVRKQGAAALREFVAANKKDFVLFQLDIALKEAGSDTAKKAAVVNQVAETISKINKTEDFSKRQDYIKQSASILKIEESGLNDLVNKLLRGQIKKSEIKKVSTERRFDDSPSVSETIYDFSEESFNLLYQDALQEQAIVRVLLEYGLMLYNDQKYVADYIFEEEIDDDIFEDTTLLTIIHTYKSLYNKGEKPTVRYFVHSENNDIAQATITATNFPYVRSKKWDENLNTQGVNKKIWLNNDYDSLLNEILIQGEINPEIYNSQDNEQYKTFVDEALIYLKLRKIRKLILLNDEDMKLALSNSEMMTLIQTHIYLKNVQMELGKKKSIVIYPF